MRSLRRRGRPQKDFQIFRGNEAGHLSIIVKAEEVKKMGGEKKSGGPARYMRDMRGYGANPPDPKWPGGAHVAVQFVLNYEEGGENSILHGDAASEAFLSEIVGAAQWPGQRHWNMESIYEYGARAGFWRMHRIFTEAGVPVTIYGVATALARSPDQVTAMQEAGWEIASHGYKWIEFKDISPEVE